LFMEDSPLTLQGGICLRRQKCGEKSGQDE